MSRFDDFDRAVFGFMTEFGFNATYVKTVSAVPDDTTGGVAVITNSIDIQAIKMELLRPLNGSLGNNSNAQIQDGDQVLYVRPVNKTDEFATAISINPESDKIKINNELWKIVTVKQYDPSASDCVLYEFYIRK